MGRNSFASGIGPYSMNIVTVNPKLNQKR